MPLYEYICTGCSRRFELLQRVGADAQDIACPACGGHEVTKQHSTFSSTVSSSPASRALPCGAPNASACGSCGCSGGQ